MKEKHIDNNCLRVSILAFFIFSISFLLMPLGEEKVPRGISALSIAAGVMFWASLIVGIATQCVLTHRIRRRNKTDCIKKTLGIGLIVFFRNKYAAIADITVAISLAALVISVALTHGTGYICYIFVSMFVFSFCLHCILNGKNYYSITRQNEAIQRKRANSPRHERKEQNG